MPGHRGRGVPATPQGNAGFTQTPDDADIGDPVGGGRRTPGQRRVSRLVGTFSGNEYDWEQRIDAMILDDLYNWADLNKVPQSAIDSVYQSLATAMMLDIRNGLFPQGDEIRNGASGGFGEGPINDRTASAIQAALPQGTLVSMGRLWYTNTIDGFNTMVQRARDYISANSQIDLGGGVGAPGRRGSGARGPTAQDIRDQFDIKQLTEMVNQLNRGLVLEDHKDPQKLARSYVDAVVKGLGKVKIDFQTFVKEQITATSRFKSIYKNKPDAVDAEQYMAPYLQAAMALARPDDAAGIAIGGAQFGGTAEEFVSRLKREDSVTGSAAFINNLGSRMRDLNSIFKG